VAHSQKANNMAGDYVIFADIEVKLATLSVERKRCGRAGRYNVDTLIEKHGRKGNLTVWLSDLKADCPKRDTPGLQDRCDIVASDLPKVL
jgi:hypothetical protein